MSQAAGTQVLTDLLETVHAAIWASGVVGANVGPDTRDIVRELEAVRRTYRDELAAILQARQVAPPIALPAYRLPINVNGPQTGLAAAAVYGDGLAVRAFEAIAAGVEPAVLAFCARLLVDEETYGARLRYAANGITSRAIRAFPGDRRRSTSPSPSASASPSPSASASG